ncbi:glycosyltransferase family 2 protein [candidate division CSSED10-310 bacterium]|uniref:Glycosyltransferase family 2 protein n=1 Tax=candidate division CSSED10-310 bacterium TaxID=2855610 RepID=A0ABV6YWD5_UNCC1
MINKNEDSGKKLVSLIILNYNGIELNIIPACLSSIFALTYPNFEVIFVDNGSHDSSVLYVQEKYAARGLVTLIVNEKNLGYGTANNIGFKHARGDYIALLNNDTEVDQYWLDEMVNTIENNAGCGMVASKTLNFYTRDIIDNVGHLLYPDGLNWARGKMEKDQGQYEIETEVAFPSGCAALYRREIFERAGGFDDDFFLFGDDTDIGLKGRLLGFSCVYSPKALVYHRYSATAQPYSPQKFFFVERNRIWILIKFFPLDTILKSPFHTLTRYFMHFYALLKGEGVGGKFIQEYSGLHLIKVFFSVYCSAAKGVFRMMQKRKKWAQKRTVDSTEIKRWLKQFRVTVRDVTLKV